MFTANWQGKRAKIGNVSVNSYRPPSGQGADNCLLPILSFFKGFTQFISRLFLTFSPLFY